MAKKSKNLVIIESPGKIETIRSSLGSNYTVLASAGHVRDLPKSTLGVDIENGFTPHYINIRGKGDTIKSLKMVAKEADKVFLATDPDREGEAIAWHLAEQLGIPLDRACRVSFNEITKPAIKEAIKSPRGIDENLVNSQQARRILDRIVGYKLSPFLWKTVKSGLSAGRVQSVATRIIVEREAEIRAFVPQEYWTLDVDLSVDGTIVTAKFYGTAKTKMKVTNEAAAQKIVDAVTGRPFTVLGVRRAIRQRQPSPPFTTSTLQQEAFRKLGFQAQRTMKVAQELYEGINLGSEYGGMQGLITYMRTDSLRVSTLAQNAALDLIRAQYGEDYLPAKPRVFKTKANAQDAHEAIRPSSVDILPKNIRKSLTSDQYRLYKLIWERFVASQMAVAEFNTVSIDFENNGYLFKTTGYTVKSRGYMAVYESPDTDNKGDEGEELTVSLPPMAEGMSFDADKLSPLQHYTEPPARYSDASLIKFLEENGIGRPSTYNTIISTIISRGYVKREGKTLVSTQLGEVTTKLMSENFPEIVDYEFTATLENKLDSIEQGDATIEGVLGEFYTDFAKELEKANLSVSRQDVVIPDEVSDIECEKCGSRMIYKNSRFGRFLACPNYPDCKNTKAIDKDGKVIVREEKKPEIADFKCEICGGDVLIRSGRYGAFYACSNYPTCRFTRQKVSEIGVACPDCGARIIPKHGRKRITFYSCEKYPECKFSSWDLPTNEKCPDCGKMLFYRKSGKSLICKDKQCGYKKENVVLENSGENEIES